MPPKRKSSKKQKANKKKLIINAVLAVVIVALSLFFDSRYHFISQLFDASYIRGENALAIHFVDVGQGDCTILQLPDGKNMIIDGGTQHSESKVLSYINKLNITVFDYLLLTHTDADHAGGMDAVILNTQVRKMYVPNVPEEAINTKTYSDFLDAVEQENLVESDIAQSLTGITITSEAGYKIVFFTPSESMYDGIAGDKNTISPVIILYYGGRSVVFTGDATKKSEEYFIDVIQNHSTLRYENTDADILKVAHHGSNSSTTAQFLQYVRPEIAVISVGEGNSYGHPGLDALNRIKGYSDTVLRTDKHGDIIITLVPAQSGAANIQTETEKQPPSDSLSLSILNDGMLYMVLKHMRAASLGI